MSSKNNLGRYGGFRPVGSKNGQAKCTEEDIKLVRACLAQKMPRREIAERLEVPLDTVHKVAQGRTWVHVQ